MAQLYVSNINFESTTNNQIVQTGSAFTVRVGGAAGTLAINSTMVSNSTGITALFAGGNNFQGNVALASTVANVDVGSSLSVAGRLLFTGNVTPALITSNTVDWSPGINGVYNIRAQANNSTNQEYVIYGMVAGDNGQLVVLNNVGSAKIVLASRDQSNELVSENKFTFPSDYTLYGYSSVTLIYDGYTQRWRMMDSVHIPYDHKYCLVKSFFLGGLTGTGGAWTMLANACRTDYSTETTASVPGANLTTARESGGVSGNADKAVFAGGQTKRGPSTYQCLACRVNYSTETTASVPGLALTTARSAVAASGNSDKGYNSGGTIPGTAPAPIATTNQTDRSVYATEVASIAVGGALWASRTTGGSASNTDKTFWAGGNYVLPTVYCTYVCKFVHSTETRSDTPSLYLTLARAGLTGMGNGDRAYFAGGYYYATKCTTVNNVCRTTYATEVTSAVPGAALSFTTCMPGAAGNKAKGFVGGGWSSQQPVSTCFFLDSVDKINYYTETSSNVYGAKLVVARGNLSSV